jgi:hypothetical protein
MSNKRTSHIRVFPEVKNKINELRRDLSIIQKEDIQTPELMRRTFNIPNLKNTLLEDARVKRFKK